jgi:hypothetical protein
LLSGAACRSGSCRASACPPERCPTHAGWRGRTTAIGETRADRYQARGHRRGADFVRFIPDRRSP